MSGTLKPWSGRLGCLEGTCSGLRHSQLGHAKSFRVGVCQSLQSWEVSTSGKWRPKPLHVSCKFQKFIRSSWAFSCSFRVQGSSARSKAWTQIHKRRIARVNATKRRPSSMQLLPIWLSFIRSPLTKHISKSKCSKHTMLGPLLEVEMSKKCTPLWREAHFAVKMYKAHHDRTTFGSCDVEKVHVVVARSTFRSQNVQNTTCCAIFGSWDVEKAKSNRLQLHYTTATAALHHTTSSSCGWGDRPGDHCNHCNHSKKTQLQPHFSPSVDSFCHPWFTTSNLSYRFPIFETASTALCGTTGIYIYILCVCVRM